MLYDKSLDEINVFKMEILEVMIENENTEKEIKQWTENHRAAVASHLQCISPSMKPTLTRWGGLSYQEVFTQRINK